MLTNTVMDSIRYVENHLDESISVREIAEEAGYSEAYFSRLFRDRMGISVMDYVKKRRLYRASEEILNGRRIIDAALDYGYQSHSGFTKAFHREFGFSPALLRTMAVEMKTLGGNDMSGVSEKQEYVKKEELFEQLKMEISRQGIQVDAEWLRKTYEYSCKMYGGIFRYSGEEYVTHPLHVAIILAKMGAEESLILAGLLCDVLKKTDLSEDELRTWIPKAAADIVVKLRALSSKDWKLPEDEAVVMVALAERLHNMRTVEHMDEAQQKIKSRETLELFLPIANRLGNERVAAELNDLAMKYWNK